MVELAQGKNIKRIALDHKLSPKTIEYHWARAKKLYHLQSYVDAVWFCLSRGWVKA
jgi:DNA-binding NarL/FixJ family response regulator